MPGRTDDARINEAFWDDWSPGYQKAHASQLAVPKVWGIFGIPESDVRALGDVAGLDVLELGCGAAQWSTFLALDRARPVGLDLSAAQLTAARKFMAERGVDFPLVHASAEDVPLESASFDLIFCDHGAMSFASPERTLPEVKRLLRPGGRLVFCSVSALAHACWNDELDCVTSLMQTPIFGQAREVSDGFVSYRLPHSEWIGLFGRFGFRVDRLVELRPPKDAMTTYEGFTAAWAHRWPAEDLWCLST